MPTLPRDLIAVCALLLTVLASLEVRASGPAWRQIPIPKQDYPEFDSVVVTSKKAYDEFLSKTSKPKDGWWNDRAGFEKALADAKIDFEKQAVAFVRHGEGSSSVGVEFRVLGVRAGRVVCELSRTEPPENEDLDADEATYCFALVIDKDRVQAVEVLLRSNRTVYLPQSQQRRFPLLLKVDRAEDRRE